MANGSPLRRISDLADAIIDPVIAVVTLTAFAIIIPTISGVVRTLQGATQTLSVVQATTQQTQQQVASLAARQVIPPVTAPKK